MAESEDIMLRSNDPKGIKNAISSKNPMDLIWIIGLPLRSQDLVHDPVIDNTAQKSINGRKIV